VVLTGRTGLVALLCVLPIAPSPWPATAFVVLLTILLALVAADVALAASTRALRFSRDGDTSARLGQAVVAVLLVHNGGRRRFRGQIRDAWAPSARAEPRTHAVDIAPGQPRNLSTELRPVRRGDQQSAIVTARSIGPLRLAGRQSSHRVPWQVRILPPFLSRKHLPSRLAKLRDIEGLLPVLIRGQGTEFDSLREYVVGDDVRSIDWRATARRGDVVVRTWRPERDRRLVCVLDTGRTSAARIGDTPRLDAALDACLLLAAVAAKAGDRVDLLAADAVVRASVEGATRNEVLPKLVQAMAPLEPALVESDAELVVAEVLRRERKRCLIVLFTALDAAPVEHGLLPVLGSLTSRHLVVLAAVGDPRVAELAAARGDAAAVYQAAAAERTLAERRRVTAQLRHRGVTVIDEPADVFASRVADTYLALKAAGRL
jgi:uncharacterized protein (DUF58 family)